MQKIKISKSRKAPLQEAQRKDTCDPCMNKALHKAIRQVLSMDKRVAFAYLYGSMTENRQGHDIDIAVFSKEGVSQHELSADLKVALYRKTGLPADLFDVRVINDLLNTGDLFTLLFLKNVLSKNDVLVDRARLKRANFLEQYGTKYRECEGLIQEVLS